jgi:hypothetical protein
LPFDPSPTEIDAQLSLIAESGSFRTLLPFELLEYLIRIQGAGRYREKNNPPTGRAILYEFYEHHLGRSTPAERHPNVDQHKGKGIQVVAELEQHLERYYRNLPSDAPDKIEILVPRKGRQGYQPQYKQRSLSSAAEKTLFTHLGNNQDAMRFLIDLIPNASLVEDTAVRWHDPQKPSLYSKTLMEEFTQALSENINLQYRSITGPVIDSAYKDLLAKAFAERPDRLSMWRLHHIAPLMNFVVLYSKKRPDGTQRKMVFFGYGRQTGSDLLDNTAVFLSESLELIREYRRLFAVLKEDRFSRAITLKDQEFGISRAHSTDVLASFPGWPDEIEERFRHCQHSIRICTVGWPALDDYIPHLGEALSRGCSVSVTLWDEQSETVAMRSGEIAHIPGNVVKNELPFAANTIINNRKSLLSLLQLHKSLKIRSSGGWASVSIYWIDDLIYFCPYWTHPKAMRGPHFLVHANSNLGGDLQRQYQTMVRRSKRILAAGEPDEAEPNSDDDVG